MDNPNKHIKHRRVRSPARSRPRGDAMTEAERLAVAAARGRLVKRMPELLACLREAQSRGPKLWEFNDDIARRLIEANVMAWAADLVIDCQIETPDDDRENLKHLRKDIEHVRDLLFDELHKGDNGFRSETGGDLIRGRLRVFSSAVAPSDPLVYGGEVIEIGSISSEKYENEFHLLTQIVEILKTLENANKAAAKFVDKRHPPSKPGQGKEGLRGLAQSPHMGNLADDYSLITGCQPTGEVPGPFQTLVMAFCDVLQLPIEPCRVQDAVKAYVLRRYGAEAIWPKCRT
jgi:hypothetical protein